VRGLGDRLKDVVHLQFEYGGTYNDRGIRLQDMYDTLLPAGFSIYLLNEHGLWHRPTPIEHNEYCNYLATQKPGALEALIH
jgi:hypothetical protein